MAARLGQGIIEIGVNTRRFSTSLSGMTRMISGFATRGVASLRRLTTMIGGLGAVGGAVGVVASLGMASKAASNFEFSMARVKGILGPTARQFRRLSGLALDLGRTTAFSASQAAEAMAEFAKSGLTANEIMLATPRALALAAAGELSMKEAASITAGVLRGMGLDAANLAQATDILAKAATSSATDVSELGIAMKYVGPVANNAGLSLEETAASLQVLADSMIRASMGGTSLRMILSQMQAGKFDKWMNKYGLSARDATGALRPLPDIIDDMNRILSQGKIEDAIEVMAIFGQRAGPAMQVLLEKGGDALRKYEQRLQSAKGTSDKLANTMMDTFRGAMLRLKSAIEGVGIAIGTKMNRKLRDLAEYIAAKGPAIADTLVKIMDVAMALIRLLASDPKKFFSALWIDIKSVASMAFGWLTAKVKEWIDMLVEQLKGAFGFLGGAAGGLAGKAQLGAKAAPGILNGVVGGLAGKAQLGAKAAPGILKGVVGNLFGGRAGAETASGAKGGSFGSVSTKFGGGGGGGFSGASWGSPASKYMRNAGKEIAEEVASAKLGEEIGEDIGESAGKGGLADLIKESLAAKQQSVDQRHAIEFVEDIAHRLRDRVSQLADSAITHFRGSQQGAPLADVGSETLPPQFLDPAALHRVIETATLGGSPQMKQVELTKQQLKIQQGQLEQLKKIEELTRDRKDRMQKVIAVAGN